MFTVQDVDFATFEREAEENGVELPLEQTEIWAKFQGDVPGRTPWKNLVVKSSDAAKSTCALVSFIEYETHGYRYLRAVHGPIYVGVACVEAERAQNSADATHSLNPSTSPNSSTSLSPAVSSPHSLVNPAWEREILAAISAFVKKTHPKVVFMRLAVQHYFSAECASLCYPVLSTRPYDSTVIIDLRGTTDDVLSRMKRRGRRDVNKALRESPAVCADETEQAAASFVEYYSVMEDTAQRDGFVPAPQGDFERMLAFLGPEHCRVYAARVDGQLVAWSIVTIQHTRATRYYAAMCTSAMRDFVSDLLVFYELCELPKRGVIDYDLMGIGSSFNESLLGLNPFKTKFSQDVVSVAPDADIPLRQVFYRCLRVAKWLRSFKK
ncbi:hypothetical protein JOD55_000195 [Arcanobacterium pluranimalium]|uniref:lipid II:glycine glycyltransferase FemX n=1 Tax=Arcanobacterium pluranimalium TaxID=108028 RepID=UPI00195DB4C4|nr:peptidoglycan bridge formation glycyltransferase FemA/FemB family protein [Arcanobacterium pluranimalium]MBM7824368.1 hypothetical protein [Arcanobacterium pluranimalium]